MLRRTPAFVIISEILKFEIGPSKSIIRINLLYSVSEAEITYNPACVIVEMKHVKPRAHNPICEPLQ